MFLFDIKPDPVPVTGVAGLVLLAVVILLLAATLIVGFVLLLKLLQRRRASSDRIDGGSVAQPSSPNQ